jgi:hypothetical protein
LFAEAFAAYTHPEYKPGMLPEKIEKIFGWLFKGIKP